MRLDDEVFINANSHSYNGALAGAEGIVKYMPRAADDKFGVKIYLRSNPQSASGYYYFDRSELIRRKDSTTDYIERHKHINPFAIKNVYFNDPVTVVMWEDGTKTIVRCGEKDKYDPEKGLAMAISKKALVNKGNYYNEFKKWIPEEKWLCDTYKYKDKNALEFPCFACVLFSKFKNYEPKED